MKFYQIISTIIIVFLLFGCSNKKIYEAVQYNQKQECRKLPYPQQSECVEEHSKSFEEYEKNREDVLKEDS